MNAALLSLVRANRLSATAVHDYTAGEPFKRFDTIDLVDPDGIPCATPRDIPYQSEDYPYNYITGASDSQVRQIRRDLSIYVDHLSMETAARLEQWMHERARVLVSPNVGRNTLLSWRPGLQRGAIYTDGGIVFDLTGNHELTLAQSGGVLLWDRQTRMFAPEAVSNSATLMASPGGAGWAGIRGCRNLFQPPYPQGATAGPGAGNAGWSKWGTDGATLSFAYNATGFGHPMCPGSLRVSWPAAASAARAVGWQGLWDDGDASYGGIPLAGFGSGVLCIWIRGRLPNNSVLKFGPNSAPKTLNLGGRTFDGWTPLCLGLYSTTWTSATGSPDLTSVSLGLESSIAEAGWCELGPVMFVQSSGVSYPFGPYWTEATTFSGQDLLRTTYAVDMPEACTLFASVYVPPDWGDSNPGVHYLGLIGAQSQFGMAAYRDPAGAHALRFTDYSSGSPLTISANIPVPNAGKVNTYAVVLRGIGVDFYANGELVGTSTVQYMRPGGAAAQVRVGCEHLGHTSWPWYMLTARVDEGNLGAAAIKNLHLQHTDPIAGAFARAARGRVYRITKIPTSLRSATGGSHVLGTIDLEQVDFNHYHADPLANRENAVP